MGRERAIIIDVRHVDECIPLSRLWVIPVSSIRREVPHISFIYLPESSGEKWDESSSVISAAAVLQLDLIAIGSRSRCASSTSEDFRETYYAFENQRMVLNGQMFKFLDI